MLTRTEKRFYGRQARFAALFLLMALIITANTVPGLRANALYLLTDGRSTSVYGVSHIADSQLIVTGVKNADADYVLAEGKKVTVTCGESVQYATTRANETVSSLLRRLQLNPKALEMVMVDVSGEGVSVKVASDFTYYETESVPVAHNTVTKAAYDLPKGETKVLQEGVDGAKDVTYEIIYADGQLVSRQAVKEGKSSAVDEVIGVGTLVSEAQRGDTIANVIDNEDGSGYLILASGDSLHFKSKMNVRGTAYTAGVGVVGTVTATGTKVHIGCVAVDRRVIPLGTKMFVASKGYTYGMGKAEDTGVLGKSVDLYMNSYRDCMNFGVRSTTVYILD